MTRRIPLAVAAALVLAPLAHAPARAEPVPATNASDPQNSPMWDYLRDIYLPGPAVFDDRVKVTAPTAAEDVFNVPVLVDASAIPDVVEIVAIADLNPLPHILTYRPEKAAPIIGFRFKVQQATPIRAAVRTADGTWHVGSAHVNAAGGGCTSPALAHGDPNWQRHLGEMQGRAWVEGDTTRLKIRVRHPMDTGLAEGIPAFFIDRVTVRAEDGEVLGTILPLEPVSENPVLTLVLPRGAAGEDVRISGRDNNGNAFDGTVPLVPVPAPDRRAEAAP